MMQQGWSAAGAKVQVQWKRPGLHCWLSCRMRCGQPGTNWPAHLGAHRRQAGERHSQRGALHQQVLVLAQQEAHGSCQQALSAAEPPERQPVPQALRWQVNLQGGGEAWREHTLRCCFDKRHQAGLVLHLTRQHRWQAVRASAGWRTAIAGMPAAQANTTAYNRKAARNVSRHAASRCRGGGGPVRIWYATGSGLKQP